MIRLTDKLCGRCDNHLATSNKNRDRLCGDCQRELGASRGAASLALREWRARGAKREITRAKPAAAPIAETKTTDAIMDPSALTSFLDRQRAAVAAKLADLDRQRREAEELLRILGGAERTDAGPKAVG